MDDGIIIREADQHVKSSQTSKSTSSYGQCGKSFTRADNLQRHMCTCTGCGVATTVAAATTVPAPATTVRHSPNIGRCCRPDHCKHEGSKAPLNAEESYKCFQANNGDVSARTRCLMFEVAASIVFHKAIDPTVVAHPPVVLTSEMVAVFTDSAPPLGDVNHQLLNFIRGL